MFGVEIHSNMIAKDRSARYTIISLIFLAVIQK